MVSEVPSLIPFYPIFSILLYGHDHMYYPSLQCDPKRWLLILLVITLNTDCNKLQKESTGTHFDQFISVLRTTSGLSKAKVSEFRNIFLHCCTLSVRHLENILLFVSFEVYYYITTKHLIFCSNKDM